MRALLGSAAVLAAVLVVAGCGGGGGSTTSGTTTTALQSATEWAGGFCGAFSTWVSSMQSTARDLGSTPTKENLQAAGDDVSSANETLVDDLQALGEPDLPRGEEAKDVVEKLSSQINDDSDEISNALEDVSTVSDIVNAASVVGTTLAKLQSQVQNAVSDLKAIAPDEDNSLKQAFADAPACTDLNNSS